MIQPASSLIHTALLVLAGAASQAQERIVVRPTDTGEALINPSMGWTLHYYSNLPGNYGWNLAPSDTVDDFPGLAVVYLRIPWSYLEPEEGRFAWNALDAPAQRWIEKGKQIALRITCTESWMRWATPKWVHDAGGQGFNFTPGRLDENGPYWEPDYGDPIFLEKLDRFLAALAARYDGNPQVAFIDIGSYGVWGEGHTWASTQKEWGDEVKRRHVDLHLKHFKRTLLAFNDDLIGPSAPGAHHELSDYALAHGITLRDDSICVQPPPHSWYHAEMAGLFWPTLPVILEHEHYGGSKQRGAWGDGSLLLQAVEEYHASYLSIHWTPREELEENRDLVRRINLRLGYRLQLREAEWPAQVHMGEWFEVRSVWANAGVAPCYPGGQVAFTLKDEQGGIVALVVEEGFDVRTLEVGPPGQAPEKTIASRFIIAARTEGPNQSFNYAPNTTPGDYDLYVSVGRRDGTPVVALPLPDGDGQRRYRLGKIRLTE